MFTGYMKLMTAHPDELVTLQELMFRWPNEPIQKICYELYLGRFTNIKIFEVIKTRPTDGGGEDIVHYSIMPWNFDQRSLCGDFNRLAVFKKEVEAAEHDNPLYSAIDAIGSRKIWYERCTAKSYRRIAPLILYVNFALVGIPAPSIKPLFQVHIRKIIESDEILSPSNCLPAPKKNWIIPEHAAMPLLRAKPLLPSSRIEMNHDFLDSIIAKHRAQGINDDVKLCRVLLEYAPNITGSSITRHIFNIIPKNAKEKDAAKKRGNRLRDRTLKTPQA